MRRKLDLQYRRSGSYGSARLDRYTRTSSYWSLDGLLKLQRMINEAVDDLGRLDASDDSSRHAYMRLAHNLGGSMAAWRVRKAVSVVAPDVAKDDALYPDDDEEDQR